MANIIGNMIKSSMDINDEIIAASMLSAAKEGADMYLNATLTSNTPELRAIYSASLGQMVEGHTTLTELNVNKGWIKPYDDPLKQLADSYDESRDIINEIRE
jgi:spore coat protein CotF